VGLSQGEAAVAVAAKGGPLTVCHRSGDTCAATHTVPAGQTWTVRTLDGDNEECRVDDGGGVTVSTGDCVIDVTWTDDGGNTRVAATGYEYAHGRLGLRPDSDEALNVVLTVDLEQYLRGVAEMPSLWPAAAQRAQAVAARNFAVRRVLDTSDTNGNPARSCDCHVLDSIYDQVYAGWSKESISPSGWLEAVEETAGRVAVHDSIGQVFTAYYSSSSGGATENNENAWGGPPIAYLRSVADPWAVEPDVDNPNASWSQSFTQSQLADILGWDTVVDVDLVEKPPGAVVRFTGVDGGAEVTRDFVGDDLRTTFGLKSPWVSTVISPYGMVDIATSVHAEDIQTLVEMGIA
jgi:peptidoglycan hydrolase-like amidase